MTSACAASGGGSGSPDGLLQTVDHARASGALRCWKFITAKPCYRRSAHGLFGEPTSTSQLAERSKRRR